MVERDRVGKITRELSYTEPQDGNNVKLTIVASYQQQAERALAENVASVRTSQEKKLMDNTWLEKNNVHHRKPQLGAISPVAGPAGRHDGHRHGGPRARHGQLSRPLT